jgi:hypothetical protein
MLRCIVEQLTSLFETVAGVKEVVDLHAVLRLLLDLVVIAMINVEGVIRFFVGPVAHPAIFFRSVAVGLGGNNLTGGVFRVALQPQ